MTYKQALTELNQEQLEVATTKGDCMVIACPGSGKTKTIATKAALLLSESEGGVGAVTFSKESATELMHRIKSLSPALKEKRLFVGTFHSMAFKQLTNRLDIASDGDKTMYVRSALAELEIEMSIKDAIALIDTHKSKGILPDAGSVGDRLYSHYQKQLSLNKKIDFSDMLLLAVEGMESGRIQPYPLKYLLIDEFQDTDPIQTRWIMCHHRAGAELTVVGDDDQSIYAFRSAMGYSGMQSFVLATNARQIVLGKNYRCRQEILGVADMLIRNNKNRIPKSLVAAKGPGGNVKIKLLLDPVTEAEFVSEDIGDPTKCSNAVLARNNKDLDIIESILSADGKPYYRPSDKSLFAYAEVAMYFGLIEMIAGLKKDVGVDSLFRIIDMSEDDRDIIHSMKISEFKKINKAELIDKGVSDDGAIIYRNFATFYEEWKSLYNRGSLSLVINGVAEWLIDKIPAKKETARRVLHSASVTLDRLQGDIASRIRFLQENKNNKPDEHAIILSTLHSSKGLEWDKVWIIRSEATICPSEKSPIEEERRLYYVGTTRAREALTITMTTKNPSSPFVMEMQAQAQYFGRI